MSPETTREQKQASDRFYGVNHEKVKAPKTMPWVEGGQERGRVHWAKGHAGGGRWGRGGSGGGGRRMVVGSSQALVVRSGHWRETPRRRTRVLGWTRGFGSLGRLGREVSICPPRRSAWLLRGSRQGLSLNSPPSAEALPGPDVTASGDRGTVVPAHGSLVSVGAGGASGRARGHSVTRTCDTGSEHSPLHPQELWGTDPPCHGQLLTK